MAFLTWNVITVGKYGTTCRARLSRSLVDWKAFARAEGAMESAELRMCLLDGGAVVVALVVARCCC